MGRSKRKSKGRKSSKKKAAPEPKEDIVDPEEKDEVVEVKSKRGRKKTQGKASKKVSRVKEDEPPEEEPDTDEEVNTDGDDAAPDGENEESENDEEPESTDEDDHEEIDEEDDQDPDEEDEDDGDAEKGGSDEESENDHEEEEPEEDEDLDDEIDDETEISDPANRQNPDENVWDAVEWDELSAPTGENVFTHSSIEEVLKDVVETAWEDGVISDDEMALLNVIKSKLDIDDETFNSILERSRPEMEGDVSDQDEDDLSEDDEDSEDEEEDDREDQEVGDDEESGEDDESDDIDDDDLLDDIDDDLPIDDVNFEDELEFLEGMVGPGPALPPMDDQEIETKRPKGPIKIEFEEDYQENISEPTQESTSVDDPQAMKYNPPPPPPPLPDQNKGPSIITFTSSVRGQDAPLGRSFDLKKEPEEKTVQRRCDSCNALIRLQPKGGKDRCPICGARIGGGSEVTSGLRSILDQAKIAFKGGDLSTAKELYGIALKQSPTNKEAKFFLMKLNRAVSGTSGTPTGQRAPSLDSRDVSNLSSGVARLDQLIGGGVNIGSQMLIKGPPYSGKDVLVDCIMASALRSGFPVIYVSSNRAMKDVMKGIVKQVPDFKKFNQERRVRMFDLFSKHKGEQVLREGHRIFNIEEKADFKRFQADLVMVQESLVQEYGGGVMIINSLSPLITQVDQNDLMKFLQVLIARSKGYRFTNIMDLASGIHHETIVNSVEYLMDGTVELREMDSRFSLRLRGFRQNIATKDWIDYNFTESRFDLVGSFNEERIM